MNLDTETLRQVFDALDNGHNGYITVEQFTSALENFYTSMSQEQDEGPTNPKLDRRNSMSVDNIVNALDPEKDGIISFDDFKSAFQNFFNCQDRNELKGKSMTVNLHGRRVSITPDDYVMQNLENDPDLKTEDSGFLETGPMNYAPSRPSTLLIKNSNASFQENTVGSPFSGSRSDLMYDDVDNNIEQLRNQMRQMEAKMESMSSGNGSDNLSGRLREENARLSASVAVLEERLKETEARYQRDLESERTHLEALMARSKRTYEMETENLRARCQRLESELSEATINLGKSRVELDSARVEGKRTNEALLDAQDKINSLMEQLNNRSDAESRELEKAIADRDNALNALKEVNFAVGSGPRLSLGSDTVARLEEMQQLIYRLKEENKTLTKKLQDAQEESWFKNLKEGHNYLTETDQTVEQELDNLTKEEVSQFHFPVISDSSQSSSLFQLSSSECRRSFVCIVAIILPESLRFELIPMRNQQTILILVSSQSPRSVPSLVTIPAEVSDLLVQEKHANNQLRAYLNTVLEKVMNYHPEILESK
ncbi:unnamed protein product [Rodentolepis nana]|uniref:EF-hand domain-containing protein n=1 Tax=Rodentolepis nana TaxID=102285 RepID=A0A0R3TN23_RODNA|nr:unnamed protein product [Rodentolepis nana]